MRSQRLSSMFRGVAVAVSSFALVTGSSGCSWMFMSRPPAAVSTPNYPVDCTSGKAAPVLDTICSGYFVANTLALASAPACSDDPFHQESGCVDSSVRGTGVALSVGLAALCGASAISGYRNAGRCSEMKGLNARCAGGDAAACQALKPGWTPVQPAAIPPPVWQPQPAPAPASAPSAPAPQPAASEDAPPL